MGREKALRKLKEFETPVGWYLPATDKWIRRVNGIFYVIGDKKYAVTHKQIVEMVRLENRTQMEVGFW